MNKLLVIIVQQLLLLLSIIIIIDVNATITQNQIIGSGLIHYPINSNGQTCNIKFVLQYSTNETSHQIDLTTDDSKFQVLSTTSTTNTTSLFVLTKTVQVNNNVQQNLNIYITDITTNSINMVNYFCNDVELSDKSIVTNASSLVGGNYYYIIKFQGIDIWDYSIIDSGSIPSIFQSQSLGNNYFLIPLSQPLFNQNYYIAFSTYNLTIGNNVPYPFHLSSPPIIKEQLYYPNSPNFLFTGMGVGIITIESNEQSLYIQTLNTKYVSAIKIGGSINKSIYMINFSNTTLSTAYKVQIQNGESQIEVPMSFNQSIISNPFQKVSQQGIMGTDNLLNITVDFVNIVIAQSMKSLLSRNTGIELFNLGFPFGYISGNSFKATFSVSTYENVTDFFYGSKNIYFSTKYITPPLDTTPPVLSNYDLFTTDGNRIIFRLSVYDNESGVKSIETQSTLFPIGKYLVTGNMYNCKLLIDMDYQDTTYIRLCNFAGICQDNTLDSYMLSEEYVPPLLIFKKSPRTLLSPNNFKYLDDIVGISFKFNQLNVTGKSIYNIMTIKLNNFPNDRLLLVRFYPSNDNPYVSDNTPVYYARYNSNTTIDAYQCEFIVPANIGVGVLQYSITLDMVGPKVIYSFSLDSSYQLLISDSQQYDFIGPIVTKSMETSEFFLNQVMISWLLTIEDSVNGYMGNGYILVRGSLDMVVRNVTGTLISGNVFKSIYKFNITVSTICSSQTYSIVYSKFIDSQGWVTEFDESIEMGTLMNPFYPLLNQSEFRHYYHECDSSLRSVNGNITMPTFLGFSNTPVTINVFGNSSARTVTFTFAVSHPDGIITNPPPTIYLTSTDQEIVHSNPLQTTFSQNGIQFTFTVVMEIPYGYGFMKNILVSLYGIVSNVGTHVGCTSTRLKSLGIEILTTFSINNEIIITGNSQLSSNGGTIWIYGKGFDQVTSLEVEYDGSTSQAGALVSSYSEIQLKINPTTLPIKVRAIGGGKVSNQITIQPFIYADTTLLINPGTPTPTVIPTNKPCKSTCGISNNQGYCSIQGYCICNSPYIGSDCSSTIILIPPPVINETQPSTEIKIPNDKIKYSSIVSIVSIRELDYNFDQVHSYTFEKWIFNSILNNETTRKYSYFTNITDSQHNVISNITAILEWNSNETVVEFAGQPITLLPSSIKYTIEISKYPFISKLNSLQLIMSTSIIKSSLNDECLTGKSDIEYGNSSSSTIDNQNNSDSNYIELKVDNYLFYGRFIKRALIDGSITSVSNIKLSNDNIEVKLGSSSSKIGINIPWYQSNAIIDPDFSLLVQSNNDDDGNCSDNGLTTAQLAGIIIGSVAVFIILVIIAFAIIYKSSRCFAVKILLYKLFRKSKQ